MKPTGPPKIPRYKRLLTTSVLLGLMLLGSGCHERVPHNPDAGPPNVVLVIVDTLRADHLGVYGHPRNTTPNIDRLARRSVVFDRAYAASSWTRSSIASLLSSMWPDEHGILSESMDERLAASVYTLPEILRDNGYTTAGWYTNPHFRFGLEQGLTERNYRPGGSADWVYRGAVSWLHHYDRKKPFFLLLHNIDPHDVYRYHREFPFAPKDSQFRKVSDWFPNARFGVGKSCSNPILSLPEGGIEEMEACYDQEVAYTDHHLGKLLSTLGKLGLMKNTVIIITADHGEEFLDHGGLWHGCTLYDELVRIPLIVYIPRIEHRRITIPVSSVDLYPTLIDFALPAKLAELQLSGQTLRPSLEGRKQPRVPAYMATRFRGPLRQAVVLGRYKMIKRAGEKARLYDLLADPNERHELSRTFVGRFVAAAMSSIARDYIGSTGARGSD